MASRKSNLNNCADFQSRHASPCTTETCPICSFVYQAKSSTLDSLSTNAIDTDTCSIAHNITAWTNVQDRDKACSQAKSLLKSGKTPNKRRSSEIRRLCSQGQWQEPTDRTNKSKQIFNHNKLIDSNTISLPTSNTMATTQPTHYTITRPNLNSNP